MDKPLLDHLLAAFQGPTGGLLITPSAGSENSAHMIAMVRNLEVFSNDLGNAGSGPQIGKVAEGLSPLGQEPEQLLALRERKAKWGASPPKRDQSRLSPSLVGLHPSRDRHAADLEPTSDFGLVQTLAEQGNGLIAALLHHRQIVGCLHA